MDHDSHTVLGRRISLPRSEVRPAPLPSRRQHGQLPSTVDGTEKSEDPNLDLFLAVLSAGVRTVVAPLYGVELPEPQRPGGLPADRRR